MAAIGRAERAPREAATTLTGQGKDPRESFGFVLGGESGSKVDTWSGVVTKWLGADPDTSIALRFIEAELDTIHRAALDIRLFDDLRLDPDTKDQPTYVPTERQPLTADGAPARARTRQASAVASSASTASALNVSCVASTNAPRSTPPGAPRCRAAPEWAW